MAGLEAGVGEHAKLGLDQLALGGDEQHAHLHAVGIGIEDLEVQLHRLHVERHVLLRFPAHQLARLLLLHALDLDLLDDHVAAADGGDDLLASSRPAAASALWIASATMPGSITSPSTMASASSGTTATLTSSGSLLGVIDDRDLDQARPDVEADRGFLATEQCHGRRAKECGNAVSGSGEGEPAMDDRGTKRTGGQIDRHATTATGTSGEACYIAALPTVCSEEELSLLALPSGIVTVRPVTGTDDTTGLGRR